MYKLPEEIAYDVQAHDRPERHADQLRISPMPCGNVTYNVCLPHIANQNAVAGTNDEVLCGVGGEGFRH